MAGIVSWDAKYFYHYPRPIQTMLDLTINWERLVFQVMFLAIPSFSSAVAEVLSHFFPSSSCNLMWLYALEASNLGILSYLILF